MTERRAPSPRKGVNLLLKLSFGDVDEFVESYATNISEGGIFIRSREPQPIGTALSFKVELAGGQRVLQGKGVVKWVRGANHPGGPAGMGVEFLELEPESRRLVDKMLASQPAAAAPPISPTAAAPAPPSIRPVSRPPAPAPQAAADEVEVPIELDEAPLLGTPIAPPTAVAVDLDFASLLDRAPTGTPLPAFPDAAPLPSVAPVVGRAGTASAPASAQVANRAGAPAAVPGDPFDAFASTGAASRGGASPIAPGTPRAAGVSPVAPVSGRAGAPPVAPVTGRSAAGAPPIAVGTSLEAAAPAIAPVGSRGAPPASAAPVAGRPVASAPPIAPGTPLDAGEPPIAPGAPLPPVARGVSLDPRRTGAPAAPAAPPTIPTLRTDSAAAPAQPQRPTGAPRFLKPQPAQADSAVVVGIDLGTSNSCCAVLVNQRPQVLKSRDGYSTVPSVVALGKNGLLVGHRAKNQQLLNPANSIYGAKRLVGRDFDSETVAQVRERFHYRVVPGPDGKAAVQLGDEPISLEEVQGLVLKECREMAEQHVGGPVTRAVITCPAYYSEQQREAVRKAAAMAGLKVERVLNEPTAAALAYGLNRGLAKKVLVYDLGGGTFDATIMRIDENVFEVQATGGDVFLGGLDFDNQVVDVLLERFQKQHGLAFEGEQIALSRVAAEAERAKMALSERNTVDVHLPMLQMTAQGQPLDLRCTLTRDEVAAACRPLIDRTLDVVQDVLLDAKMKASELDDIILVGGQSRMPLVRERLKAALGKAPMASVNADEAVALGAALYAGTVDKVSNVVLIDVVPMTLGLGLPGGGFKRLIERNTPLPASKSFALETSKDNEEVIELNIFQGEDADITGNEYVGTTRIEGLPRGAKGSVKVAVTVRLDAECVVHVEARELNTRKAFSATLATRYTSEQIRQKLGIQAPQRKATSTQRSQELEQRGGRFWSALKRLVGVK